jgi:trk system potassium uptake protein TrkH
LRSDVSLKKKYRAILSYCGSILFLGGSLMLLPLLCLFFWPEEIHELPGFLLPALLLIGLGLFLWLTFKSSAAIPLTVQEGGVIVLVIWVFMCLVSAWPFVQVQGMNFTQSVFESVSGWTTTGLSVVDVTKASHMLLLWRSIMQLFGGAGFAVIMLSAIAGPVGAGLTSAEGRSEQLAPHVRKSAKLVMGIYGGYALLGFLAYFAAGMLPFDAVTHAFAAISTGGFSTRPESIAFWNSPLIEAITIILMILGNLNFLTAYFALKGKIRTVLRNGEVKLFAVLSFIAILTVFFFLCVEIYPTFGKAARVAIFETVSALTTTGFTSTSYSHWNAVGFLTLIVLMVIGGGTGSTAGGIKQYRIFLLYKSLLWQVRRFFLPRTAVVENFIWHGDDKDYITDGRIREIANAAFLYLVVLVLGTAILAAHNYSLHDSLFEFASALSTVGLSVGITTASAPGLVLWTEIAGMFLGRLEFLIIFVGLGKIIRDVFHMTRSEKV